MTISIEMIVSGFYFEVEERKETREGK